MVAAKACRDLVLGGGQALTGSDLADLDVDALAAALPKTAVFARRKPSHWDIGFIRRFMLAFGPLSSMFDFATFGIMQWVFNAGPERFRSGWLVESLATQTLVIFAIRPRRIPFFRSRASRPLILSALGVVAIGTVLHDSPLASTLGFESLPWGYCAVLVAMVVAYLALVEAGKHLPYGLGPTAAARRRPDRTRHQRCRAARFSTRRKPGEAAVMRGGRRVRGHGKRPCRPPRAVVRRWRRP